MESGGASGFKVAAEQLAQLPEHEQLETLQARTRLCTGRKVPPRCMCNVSWKLLWHSAIPRLRHTYLSACVQVLWACPSTYAYVCDKGIYSDSIRLF